MEQGNTPLFRSNNWLSRLTILIGLILILSTILNFLGLFLVHALFKVGPAQLQHYLSHLSQPEILNSVKLLQVLGVSLGVFILPSLLYVYVTEGRIFVPLRLNSSSGAPSYLLVFIAMMSAVPFINWMIVMNAGMELSPSLSELESWMRQKEDAAAIITKAFLDMRSPNDLLINLVLLALLPALGEELLFRGALQPLFIKTFANKHVAVWFTAIVFSAMHMQFFGFFPRMMLGVFLGYLFLWSNTIWLPVCAHFINNAFVVVSSYIIQKNALEVDIDQVGTDSGLTVVLSLCGTLFLMFLIWKWEQKND